MEKDNYILITGATSSIGSAIVETLSDKYKLIIHGRNKCKLQKLLNSNKYLKTSLLWEQDLNDVDNIENNLKNLILSYNIKISCFIHVASILSLQPIKIIKLKTIQESLNVNYISSALITKTLLSHTINPSLENIVFISSNICNRGAKAFSLYASTKGAVDSMMRCLSVELAPKVRVNSVLPGAIKSQMTKNIFEDKEIEKRMLQTYPLGFGEPNDIAQVVEFLISDNAKWITGQQIVVDGGRIINITG